MSSPETASPPSPTSRHHRWSWIIPAVAFLLGLLLGAGLMTTVGHGPGPGGAHPSVADPTTSAGPQKVVLPASCRQALQQAKTAATAAQGAVDAVRHLQTARLQRLLDDLEKTRQQLDLTTARCQQATRTAD